MLQVHFVLNQFDDGHQQIGVSQPAENVFKSAQVFVGHAFAYAVAEGRQYHNRDMRIVLFNPSCSVEYFRFPRAGHADDQVIRHGLQLSQSLVACGSLAKAGRISQRKRGILIENLFIDAAIVFQHESIIRIGNEQDIENPALHQVGKLSVFKI